MTELTSSCIATVSENCFTSVLHGAWHLWTGIPAQYDCTTHYNYSAFLGFASETSILMSPHKFSIGLRSGDWAGHSITLILLVWNQDDARLLVCLGSLSYTILWLLMLQQAILNYNRSHMDSCMNNSSLNYMLVQVW